MSTRFAMRSASTLLLSVFVFVSMAFVQPGLATATRPGQNGVIAYEGCTDTAPIECGLMFMNGDGSNRRLIDANAHGGRWSPDGQHMLFSNETGGITVYDTQTRTGRELITTHPFGEQFLAWSPDWSADGAKIAFIATGTDDPEEEGQIYVANVSTGTVTRLFVPSLGQFQASDLAWSPNGIHLAVRANNALYIVDFGGLSRLIGADAGGSYMSFSPDGRYIAASPSGVTSEAGLTVTDITTGSVRNLSDNRWASWSPDGAWIAYGNGSGADPFDVFRVRPDGTDLQRLTNFVSQTEAGGGTGPDWQCLGPTCLLPLDTDVDGVRDTLDNCFEDYNPDQLDNDRDGEGNECDETPDGEDLDVDADGVLDDVDNCFGTYNPDQADADNDGVGDACAGDIDNDGIHDSVDNCPDDYNPLQENADGDTLGDACDVVCEDRVFTDGYVTAYLINALTSSDEVMELNTALTWCTDGVRTWVPSDSSAILLHSEDGSVLLSGLSILLGMSFQYEPSAEVLPLETLPQVGPTTVEFAAEWDFCVNPLSLLDVYGGGKLIAKSAVKANVTDIRSLAEYDKWVASLHDELYKVYKKIPGYNSVGGAIFIDSLVDHTVAPLLTQAINELVVYTLNGGGIDTRVCFPFWAPVVEFHLLPDGSASVNLANPDDSNVLDFEIRQD